LFAWMAAGAYTDFAGVDFAGSGACGGWRCDIDLRGGRGKPRPYKKKCMANYGLWWIEQLGENANNQKAGAADRPELLSRGRRR